MYVCVARVHANAGGADVITESSLTAREPTSRNRRTSPKPDPALHHQSRTSEKCDIPLADTSNKPIPSISTEPETSFTIIHSP
ncbi:hypothetical protein EJ05DRAFT_129959 [Pseudovirgaria hyperparasitica]|uniref:Uncharacterized protein n=1 Tax=Pseudovirgaria hyperparasitica TaxID=470096 RepID=A0A6A6VVS5_9PEZI|nr:uncharacterized protein EJ05DRAFT_129959 [Pseudovirgaria hyperparasitica]KAF2754682.1 hypothetical protein EJ05DRAFT_129959 [Pseudovirgaria hyperparasitica]